MQLFAVGVEGPFLLASCILFIQCFSVKNKKRSFVIEGLTSGCILGFAGGIYIAPAGIAAFGQSRASCAHRLQVLSGEGCHHEDIRHSQ